MIAGLCNHVAVVRPMLFHVSVKLTLLILPSP